MPRGKKTPNNMQKGHSGHCLGNQHVYGSYLKSNQSKAPTSSWWLAQFQGKFYCWRFNAGVQTWNIFDEVAKQQMNRYSNCHDRSLLLRVRRVKTRVHFFQLTAGTEIEKQMKKGKQKAEQRQNNVTEITWVTYTTHTHTQTLDMLMSSAVTCEQVSEWVLVGWAVLLSEAASESTDDRPRVSVTAFSALINFTWRRTSVYHLPWCSLQSLATYGTTSSGNGIKHNPPEQHFLFNGYSGLLRIRSCTTQGFIYAVYLTSIWNLQDANILRSTRLTNYYAAPVTGTTVKSTSERVYVRSAVFLIWKKWRLQQPAMALRC